MNDLWRPRSDCGPRCLPAPGEIETISRPRQAARLVALLALLLLGPVLAAVLLLLPAARRTAVRLWWARRLLRALGVALVVRGSLPARRALLVANHISWLDVVAVLAVAPGRLVAKRELRRWPVLGWLAAVTGTIFVDRSRPRALPTTVAELTRALRAGRLVTVFPEGTTGCGSGPGSRFRPAMFQGAIDAGAPVVPIRISYALGGGVAGPTTVAAFLGEESLSASLRRVLRVRRLVVSVAAGAALHCEAAADRRQLARVAESVVRWPVGPAGSGALCRVVPPPARTRPWSG